MKNETKIILLVILLCFLVLPLFVNAESNYLYDVLKNEAESSTLAKEYTGEHHDSFTEEPSKKVYHWNSDNSTESNQIREKDNVLFGGFCWQIIRTTDTGGVKMIYNGIPNEGKCNNVYNSRSIGKSKFNNNNNSLAYSGYMYNNDYIYSYVASDLGGSEILFGNNVTYNNGVYSLNSTRSGIDYSHRYSCHNTTGICSTVRYYFYSTYYIELNNGKTAEQALNDMLYSDDVNKVDSTIKQCIDDWFENNLLDYTQFIEDTIYCNDRSIYQLNGWDNNSTNYGRSLIFNNNNNNSSYIKLNCENETDSFSMNNSKARLKYPIGLFTPSEMKLLKDNNLRIIYDDNYWLSSPSYANIYTLNSAINYSGDISDYYVENSISVRPAISLKPNIKYYLGNGSQNTPYIIDTRNIHSIHIEIVDETEDLTVQINDLSQVEEGEEVSFKVTPITGYKVNNLKIVDEDNNEIDYTTTDNENYKFIMPAADITIIPIYERVKNAVIIEDNNNTKEFIIEVNNAQAVIYEDKVVFTITPEEGYEVENIIIKDENNNTINYKKLSNNKYEFTMPDTDVMISPKYRKIESINKPDTIKNPNTGDKLLIILLSIFISIGIVTIIYKKNSQSVKQN